MRRPKPKPRKLCRDIVKDEMPDGDRRDFVVIVKDEAGRELVRVTLSLAVESLS